MNGHDTTPAGAPLADVLAPALHTQRVAARRGNVAKGVAYAAVALVFMVGGALLIVLQLQAREIAADVASCINPGGACYERATDREQQVEELTREVHDLQGQVDDVLILLCVQQPDARQCEP